LRCVTAISPVSTRFVDPVTRVPFANNQIPVSQMDPVGRQIVNLYPVPQTGGTVNNYTQTGIKQQIDNSFDVRGDHRISDADTLFVQYSYNNIDTVIPGSLPIAPNGVNPVGNQNFTGTSKESAHGAKSTKLMCSDQSS
jgi:hypothetical protein